MRSHFQKILLQFSGIFLTLPLGAQAFRVDAVQGVSGRDGSVTLELASSSGKEPPGLQWDFSVSDGLARAFAVSRDARKAPLHDVSADIEILK